MLSRWEHKFPSTRGRILSRSTTASKLLENPIKAAASTYCLLCTNAPSSGGESSRLAYNLQWYLQYISTASNTKLFDKVTLLVKIMALF